MLHEDDLHKPQAQPQAGLQPVPAVVLCRVESAGNVGAICRAMATMGFHRLILAACPDYDPIPVRTWSLSAWPIYERAERYPSLELALSAFSYATAFSRRSGRRRKQALSLPDWIGTMVDRLPESVALVFGNEKNGLDTAELAQCDEAVFIPSDANLPSLNVSHAVQLVLWEWRRSLLLKPTGSSLPDSRQPAARSHIFPVVEQILEAMQNNGCFALGGRADTGVFLRELAARAAMSEAELERLRRLLVKNASLAGSRDRGDGPA